MDARATPHSAAISFAQMRDSVAHVIKEKSALVSYVRLVMYVKSSRSHLKVPLFLITVSTAEEGHDVDRTSGCARIRLRRTRRAELLVACGRGAARGVSNLEIG